jgi:hypothetical protein
MNLLKRTLVALISLSLVCATIPQSAGAWPVPARAIHAFQEVYAPASGSDLDALVAPIALYPDALVAQVLGAATFPDQVVDADAYLKANPNLTGDPLMQAVGEKPWDPSIQALAQFPSVLDKLARNIAWTSALGDASANQQADVMAAVQRMRAKAYAAGTLKSGDQIKVVQESPTVIVVQSANPQIIYVPTYNPTVVYGAPVTTPGYSTSTVVAASIISFGVGIAVGAAINGSSCGYSYSSWGMNWNSRAVYCGGGMYYGNPYWWGGYYPGYHPGYRPPYYYPPPRPPMHPPPGYRPPYPPGYRPPGYGARPTPLPATAAGRPGGSSTSPARPGGATTLPANPNRPGNPSTLPSTPSRGTGTRPAPGTPTTRPATGTPATQPAARELRGYPAAPKTQPAPKPNAFSGTAGGRPQSARGNQSMSAPAARPSGGASRR